MNKIVPYLLTFVLAFGLSLYLGTAKTTAYPSAPHLENNIAFEANPYFAALDSDLSVALDDVALGDVGLSKVALGDLTAIDATGLPSMIAQGQSSGDGKTIRIGYQKYGSLNLLKAKGGLETRLKSKGVSVQWVLFPAGPALLEALNAGAIDFGSTGEAPPIFAQAAGAPLAYVGHQPPNPKGEAILVKKDSPIKTVKDLKGKRIAFNKGSNVHYFLIKALESAGLKYSDITPVFLPPGDARPAFEQGSVDAWAIWDPFYTSAKRALNARVVRDGAGLVANREFFLSSKSFAKQYPDHVKAILAELDKIDEWVKRDPKEIAELLSPQLGIDVASLEEIIRRRPLGILRSLKPEVIAYQQNVADVFLKLGLIPKPIQVKDAVVKI